MLALSIVRSLPRHSLRLLSALLAVLLLACSQGDGETCQNTRDCDDGLICLLGRGDNERGVCGTPDEIEPGGEADAGEPMLPPDDAGAGDAGLGDAAADDAGDPSEQDAGDDPADVDAG